MFSLYRDQFSYHFSTDKRMKNYEILEYTRTFYKYKILENLKSLQRLVISEFQNDDRNANECIFYDLLKLDLTTESESECKQERDCGLR